MKFDSLKWITKKDGKIGDPNDGMNFAASSSSSSGSILMIQINKKTVIGLVCFLILVFAIGSITGIKIKDVMDQQEIAKSQGNDEVTKYLVLDPQALHLTNNITQKAVMPGLPVANKPPNASYVPRSQQNSIPNRDVEPVNVNGRNIGNGKENNQAVSNKEKKNVAEAPKETVRFVIKNDGDTAPVDLNKQEGTVRGEEIKSQWNDVGKAGNGIRVF